MKTLRFALSRPDETRATALRRTTLLLVAAVCISTPTTAQTVSPVPTDAATLAKYDKNKNGVLDPDELAAMQADKAKSTKEAEIVNLSPFEVVVEKDKGFMATNAGTATKLGLDLQDIPAAYSVMTREFIDALGITSIEESAVWATSGGIANTDGTPNDSTSTPNTVFTVQRGQINQTGQQRNFFLNAGIGDTYNVERIDYGRGPNAVLFNYGDINNPFAGGVSAQTKSARLDRKLDTLTFKLGSWGNRRATVDINQPLTDKLAVRGNALWQENSGWRHGAQDNRKGGAIAANYRLNSKTEIKLSGNYDHIERTQTYQSIYDQLSGWDGVTIENGPLTDATIGKGRDATTRAPLAGTPNSRGQVLTSSGDVQGIGRIGGASLVYVPGQGIMNWQNFAVTKNGDSNEYVPVHYNGQTFSRYDLWTQDVAQGTFTASNIAPNNLQSLGSASNFGGIPLLEQVNLPGDRFDRAIQGSSFRLPDRRFTVMPKTPFLIENNRDVHLDVTHKFSDNLFFSLSADANDTARRIINQGTANRMRYAYLDINQNLPDGTPNPNFLQVYSDDTIIAHRKYRTKNWGVRPTINYALNLHNWGAYTFNLGASITHRIIIDRQFVYSMAQDPDPRKWAGGSSVVKVREYWNNPLMPIDALGSLSYFTNIFDSTNNVIGSSRTTVTPKFVNNGGSDQSETNKGLTFALAGRYFNSENIGGPRLVLLTGGFFSKIDTSFRSLMNRGDMPITWDSQTMLYKPNAPSDWLTLTYIPKDAAGNPTGAAKPAATRPRATNVEGVAVPLAQYANDRFRDDYNSPDGNKTTRNLTTGFVYHALRWVSAKVNYSNSFVPPPSGTFDLNSLPVNPTQGFGYDARLSFTPFGDRFTWNVGWFYNESKYARVNSPAAGNIATLLNTRDYTDLNTSNRNSAGFTDLSGLTDYQSKNNTGYEFEVVGKITRGLEITGSYSRFRGKTFNNYPLTIPYINEHAADYLTVLQAAGGTLDTTNKPSGASHAPGLAVPNPALATFAIDRTNQNNAINAYNNIWVNYDTVFNKVNDSNYGSWGQTFNTFVRYQFEVGKLRGLRIGLGATWNSEDYFSNHAGDLVPNPNYDSTKGLNTNTGLLDASGRYSFKDANGKATGFNAPWMPDPNINQLNPLKNKTSAFTNTVLNVGYTHRLKSRWALFDGKEISYNLVVNNLLNRQHLKTNYGVPRAPNGDYTQQNTRVVTAAGISMWQQPINFTFETSMRF